MFQAEHAEISPLRLGFTGSLRVVRALLLSFKTLSHRKFLFELAARGDGSEDSATTGQK
jgi:hypothetical protein